jgi:hypothetical protein
VVGVRELDDERARSWPALPEGDLPGADAAGGRPGRPFPYISNLSLSLAVLVRDPVTDQTVFARVKVPTEILPRFVRSAARPADASCRSRT